MAKVIGAQHSDFVQGQVGGTCFRGYRGQNIVSCSRRMTKSKPGQKLLRSPLDLKKLFARYSADQLVTLRTVPPNFFVTSWGDQKGGIGVASETVLVRQPAWLASDSERGGRAYVEPDGLDDGLLTATLTAALQQPFELWMVSSEPIVTASEKKMLGFLTGTNTGVYREAPPSTIYKMKMTDARICGNLGDGKVKVWRWRFGTDYMNMEWNGGPQFPNQPPSAGGLAGLRFFNQGGSSNFCKFKCFEIAIFSSILSEVERGQLLRWYFDTYNLPD